MWRKWGTPQNFSLAFIDEFEKQVIIRKTVEVGQQKTIILIFTMLYFFYQNLDDMIYMIYSSWDIEQNILKLVILGHPLPFYPNKNLKIKFFKKGKICWRYLHFTHVHQKSESYDVQFLQYRVRQAELFATLGHFLPFQPPDNLENENFKI